MKEVTKEEELRFLRKLEVYFKHITPAEIDQKIGDMEEFEEGDFANPCGCFGAHIAKAFRRLTVLKRRGQKFYGYTDGRDIFRDNISRETEDLFVQHCDNFNYGDSLNVEEYGLDREGIFSYHNWGKHPHTVIRRVIRELELELEE